MRLDGSSVGGTVYSFSGRKVGGLIDGALLVKLDAAGWSL
jgi:hypothetical protein